MHDFIQELKKRNVIRVTFAYVVFAWLVAQAAELVLDSFEAPSWMIQILLLILAMGLVITVLFAWAFEITPEGIKKEKDVDRSKPIARRSVRKLNFVLVSVLALALTYFLAERFILKPGSVEELAQSSVEQTQSTKVVSPRSIAVLPFTNRSVEEDTLYFVDGVHDELLTQLARIGDLKVISRTSVLEYRDTTKNMRVIGQELGVATLMEGAVQRAGDRVRITAQLIDANTDEHLWADSFDRELTPANIFEIQTEIARAIAGELAVTFAAGGGNTLDRSPTTNQAAYDLYMRARAIPFDGSEENLLHGIDLARQAVELDPAFALAMGQIAENYINIYWFTTQQREQCDAAQHWTNRALAIAPEDPRLQLVLAQLLYACYLDYDAALAALDKAQHGMPGVSSVYLNRGAVLRRSGRIEEAITAFEKAQSLDPRDVFNAAHNIFTYTYIGDVVRAKRQADIVLAMPNATTVHIGFTREIDLFMLGDTAPMTDFLRSYPDADLGPEDQLKVFVPFLERRYDDALAVLLSFPDPIVEQTNLWTHSFVRARVLHAQGKLVEAREQAALAVAELDQIAATMPTNARPLVSRALMQAMLGHEAEARADARRAMEIYPIEIDPLDGPGFMADGLRALAVFADTEELARELEIYLSLKTKAYYVDYLLLDPVFDRHRDHPAIKSLQKKYTLRKSGSGE